MLITLAFGSFHQVGIAILMYVRGLHVVCSLHVHLVFVTEYRRKAMADAMLTGAKRGTTATGRRYLWGGQVWSGSLRRRKLRGTPVTVVKQYIENQKRPV
ncbi:hypothetical protein ACFQ7B_33015 [Streptomyces erythrochromogenes]|uniref:hypothetical protein n=1 Tax=Streptomyces erythrochromogenes TaxID=285574 RepID=UPI0036CDB2B6